MVPSYRASVVLHPPQCVCFQVGLLLLAMR